MIRLLSKEDVREEFRDRVSQLVRCPVLKRNHTALMCFACSRKATCEVAKEVEIADLDVDDVVYDSAHFKKATLQVRWDSGYEPISGTIIKINDLKDDISEVFGIDGKTRC